VWLVSHMYAHRCACFETTVSCSTHVSSFARRFTQTANLHARRKRLDAGKHGIENEIFLFFSFRTYTESKMFCMIMIINIICFEF
jgi:hypothetical protein